MENSKCEKDKIQKIKNIIEREIEKELNNKQNEVTEISDKIKTVLRNLDLLKYIAAVNYYDQNPSLNQKKGQEDENEEEKTQHQIHPCIKKLFPFKSNYNNLFVDPFSSHSYETRQNKKGVCNKFTAEVKKEVSSNSHQGKNDSSSNNIIAPQCIEPLPCGNETVEKVPPDRGGLSKEKYRVIIGNISKWIPPDSREDNSTHKWMVYVRSKDSDKDVTKLLKKVRYFLHESYKPHDIIDVFSPPFRLTRRGWGEFPIRVQFYFINPLNKPVDIVHNLKLDMTYSGVQMLGGETVVDMCLYPNNSVVNEQNKSVSKPNLVEMSNTAKEESVKEKQDVFDGSLLTIINGVKLNGCVMDIKKENRSDEIVIKQEPEDYFEYEELVNPKTEEMNIAINNSRMFTLDRRKIMKIIDIEHDYTKMDTNESDKSFNNYNNSVIKLEGGKKFKNGAYLEPVHVNQIMKKKSQLDKLGMWFNKSEEDVFKKLRAVASKVETETQSKYCMKAFRQMYLANIVQRAQATKLTSVESLVKWFVQRWPIVTNLSLDPTYKIIHPYSSPSEEEFFKYNIGKQRSAEWFRAKAIQKVLQTLKATVPIEEEIWTTKQILLWSRYHGNSPSSFQKMKNIDSSEVNESRNKRLKGNDSSSDSDEGFPENPLKRFLTSDERFVNGLNATDRKKGYKKGKGKEFSEEVVDGNKNYKELNPCSETTDSQRFGANEFHILESSGANTDIEVVEVDGETITESPSKNKEAKLLVVTTPSSEKSFNKFVCDTAREIGVKLREEEIIPGVLSDSVSRVLSQCTSNFLDELLRRSFAHAWLRNAERCPDSLEVNDILATLIECPRFDIFTNRGLGIPSEKS